MGVMGIKDNKCLFITLFLLALATETCGSRKYGYETRGYETRGYHSGKVQMIYLPEDAAKAEAFKKDLAILSRRRRLGIVSTTWLTAAAGDSETAEVALMKKLQDKMEQLESKLDTTLESIIEVKKTTEKNDADPQKASCDNDTCDAALALCLQSLPCPQNSSYNKDNCTPPSQVPPQTPSPADEGTTQTPCPGNMTQTQLGCLKEFRIGKNWTEASKHCDSLGLELASLEMATTKDNLTQLQLDLNLLNGTGYWVDLTRSPSGEDTAWRWRNGARVKNDSLLWDSKYGKPNNGPSDDRGWFFVGYDGLADDSGSNSHNFLCAVP